jgi:hypothetical protein
MPLYKTRKKKLGTILASGLAMLGIGPLVTQPAKADTYASVEYVGRNSWFFYSNYPRTVFISHPYPYYQIGPAIRVPQGHFIPNYGWYNYPSAVIEIHKHTEGKPVNQTKEKPEQDKLLKDGALVTALAKEMENYNFKVELDKEILYNGEPITTAELFCTRNNEKYLLDDKVEKLKPKKYRDGLEKNGIAASKLPDQLYESQIPWYVRNLTTPHEPIDLAK